MTPDPFDFRKPPPGEFGRRASAWLTAACRRTSGPWARTLPFAASLAVGHIEVVGAAAVFAALPEDAVSVPVLAGAEPAALLVMRRPFLLALLAGVVGETPASLPQDRDTTELEASLVGYAARELFLDPLERGWPGAAAPQLTAGALAAPRLAWTANGGDLADLALFATLDATAPFGQQPVYLVVPRGGPWAALAVSDSAPRAASVAPAAQIEALVRQMPVELEVLLGTADVSMRELSGLRAGDVLVLGQKVDEPLDGLLAGARKFRVWPGTVGAKAAVQVDAPTE
jgi:flagellar motor switch protein FliM